MPLFRNSYTEMEANRKRIIAVIPVHGRERLALETVRFLRRQDYPPQEIVIVGESRGEEELAEATGAIFVSHPNNPLGAKFQAGVNKARELKADALMMLGSDDWITSNWCSRMMQEIDKGFDLVGGKQLFILSLGFDARELVCLSGYQEPERRDEPLGAGRMFSRRILDKMEWKVFPEMSDGGLDGASYSLAVAHGAGICVVEDEDAVIMDIKSPLWKNKWSFEQFSNAPGIARIAEVDEWLRRNFPGSDLFLQELVALSIAGTMPSPWGI